HLVHARCATGRSVRPFVIHQLPFPSRGRQCLRHNLRQQSSLHHARAHTTTTHPTNAPAQRLLPIELHLHPGHPVHRPCPHQRRPPANNLAPAWCRPQTTRRLGPVPIHRPASNELREPLLPAPLAISEPAKWSAYGLKRGII